MLGAAGTCDNYKCISKTASVLSKQSIKALACAFDHPQHRRHRKDEAGCDGSDCCIWGRLGKAFAFSAWEDAIPNHRCSKGPPAQGSPRVTGSYLP